MATMATRTGTVVLLVFAAVGATAAETHDAHEHGAAEIELAVEGAEVVVNFASPLYNLVGFEHAPHDEADREAVAAARALLDDPANLAAFHADAGCMAVDTDVHWGAADAAQEDEHDAHGDEHDAHADEHEAHEDEPEEQHADVTVAIRYSCDQPDRLASLTVTAFESFERLEEVEVRGVGPGGAVAETPSRSSPEVDLRGLFER